MSALWREKYGKPVSIDECCYEGTIAELWGNISGQKMVRRFWDGVVNGGYVTHGETFNNDTQNHLVGQGRQADRREHRAHRLPAPHHGGGADEELDPVKSTGAYRITMQGGLDNVVLQQLFVPPAGEEDWSRARPGGRPPGSRIAITSAT